MERTKKMRVKKQSIVSTKVPVSKACGLHCIKIKNITVKMNDNLIVDDVSIHVHCGKLTAIIGKNGAGKTTLIKAILGEIKHEGKLEFKDPIKDTRVKPTIGYVPQHLSIAKNSPTSVYDMFASYFSSVPVFLYKSKKVYQKIKDQLKKFEAESLIDKAVCDLSGGELQRVLLSIATMPIPNLLILDEPVSGVDHNGMELFYKNIADLKENYDLAIILISHDLDFVRKYADHVVLLNKRIMKEGTPSQVFESKEFLDTFGSQTYLEG